MEDGFSVLQLSVKTMLVGIIL